MRKHRGEIIERAVRESGMSLVAVSSKLKVSRRTLYNYFDQADLSVEMIERIGKVIHADINELLEMVGYSQSRVSPTASEKGDDVFWKNKYIDLLEKYNALLEETSKAKMPGRRK